MERGEMEEIKRHFGVVAEGLRSEMRQIAEGVTNMDEKLERFRREVQEEFKEVKAMIISGLLKYLRTPSTPSTPYAINAINAARRTQ